MAQTSKLQTELVAALAKVPAGRVVTYDVLARHVGCNRPHLIGLLAALAATGGGTAAWHRAVAEGGAIGRHRHRERQMTLLRADGVAVSPAGIVDGLEERKVADLDRPVAPIPAASAAPTRSRGMKLRPG